MPPTLPDPHPIAEALALVLPPECVAGVDQNVALLARHWDMVRRALADHGIT